MKKLFIALIVLGAQNSFAWEKGLALRCTELINGKLTPRVEQVWTKLDLKILFIDYTAKTVLKFKTEGGQWHRDIGGDITFEADSILAVEKIRERHKCGTSIVAGVCRSFEELFIDMHTMEGTYKLSWNHESFTAPLREIVAISFKCKKEEI